MSAISKTVINGNGDYQVLLCLDTYNTDIIAINKL